MIPIHKIKTSVKIPDTKWTTNIAIRRLYPNVNWVSNYHPSGRNYRKWTRAGVLTSGPHPTSWAGCFQGWQTPLRCKGAEQHLFLNGEWGDVNTCIVHITAPNRKAILHLQVQGCDRSYPNQFRAGLQGNVTWWEHLCSWRDGFQNHKVVNCPCFKQKCQFWVWGV